MSTGSSAVGDFRESKLWWRIKLVGGTALLVAGVIFILGCIAPVRDAWTRFFWGQSPAVSSMEIKKQGVSLYLKGDANPDDVRSLVRTVMRQDLFHSIKHVRWENMDLVPIRRDVDADAVAAAFVGAVQGRFSGKMEVGSKYWWEVQCGDPDHCGQAALDLVTVLVEQPRWWTGVKIESDSTFVAGSDPELLREVTEALQPWRGQLDGFFYAQNLPELGLPHTLPPNLTDPSWLPKVPALMWVGLDDVDVWEAHRSITTSLSKVAATKMVLTTSGQGPSLEGDGDAASVRGLAEHVDGTLLAAATDLSYVKVRSKQLSDVRPLEERLDEDAVVEWMRTTDGNSTKGSSVRVTPATLRALEPLTKQLGARLNVLGPRPYDYGPGRLDERNVVDFTLSRDDACGAKLDCEGIARTLRGYEGPIRITLRLPEAISGDGAPNPDQLDWAEGEVTMIKMESPVAQELYRLLGGR